MYLQIFTNKFLSFLSFRKNQRHKSNFQQVGNLVKKNISVFLLQQVALYLKGIPNSIDFYKETLLHVISACIIVS